MFCRYMPDLFTVMNIAMQVYRTTFDVSGFTMHIVHKCACLVQMTRNYKKKITKDKMWPIVPPIASGAESALSVLHLYRAMMPRVL